MFRLESAAHIKHKLSPCVQTSLELQHDVCYSAVNHGVSLSFYGNSDVSFFSVGFVSLSGLQPCKNNRL